MNGSSFLLVLRLALSLGLVFGLMWVAIRVMRGRDGFGRRQSMGNLEIVEQRPLTKNSSIAIVRIADQMLAVGITEHQITLLNSTPLDIPLELPLELPLDRALPAVDVTAVAAELPAALMPRPAQSPKSGGGLLDTLRDLTVRHEVGVER